MTTYSELRRMSRRRAQQLLRRPRGKGPSFGRAASAWAGT